MKILVIGASRGIGFELARQYAEAGNIVVGTARSAEGLEKLKRIGARALPLDITDAASCAALSWPLDGERFDIVVMSAGVFGPRLRELETPSESDFDWVMRTNVLGPMRVLPLLVDMLAPGARVVVLSSRMGSIGARTAANASLYRASKAAVNSVLKDASLILGSQAVCIAIHPGWVRTDMGGEGADLSVEDSVRDLRQTIGRIGHTDNGSFLNHDGTALPW